MNRVDVCWFCRGGVVVGEGFCPTCRVIQPPDPRRDHFHYFGLNPGFDLDLGVLDTVYRQRQQQFHPDLFVSRGATERRYSMEHVTRLNEGYRTLKDPLTRGEYLLKVTGFREQTPENATPSDPAFLLEIMEWRETLEEVDLKGKNAAVQLQQLRDRMMETCDAEVVALGKGFHDWFVGGKREGLAVAAQHTDRLRYFTRFLDELDRKSELFF